MNVLHMKYACEVARQGSLGKASEKLLIAVPNLSRSIKELEADLGITIFERTAKGMQLTPDGEQFMRYAKNILGQIDEVENLYRGSAPKKQSFSISVPRASYISDALAEFSKTLTTEDAEIFYKETNSERTIHNLLDRDYKLGIIRYAENYNTYFDVMMEEKGLTSELLTSFSYRLIMSRENPLSQKAKITFDDLEGYIEVAHADPYVPSLPLAKVIKTELPDNIKRRIFLFERASQFDLLSKNPETFMWGSPTPQITLDRYNLIQRECVDNHRIYRDFLIYKKGYRLSELDQKFISALNKAIKEHW